MTILGEERVASFRLRVLFAGLILGLLHGVVVARAVDLMVVQGPKLREMAEKQHRRVVKLTPRRGSIVDRNGVVFAESVPVDSVYAHPNQIENPVETAMELARILGMDENKLLEKLAKDSRFTWIKRAVTPEQADAVRSRHLDGVVVVGEFARFYPQESLASHIIGFAGSYGEGLEGVERMYDDMLAGDEEEFVIQRDARGKPLYRDTESIPEPKGGDSVVLTIDARIQAITEEALDKAVRTSDAESGIAAVMEVGTGRILAMATRPTFDPNNYNSYPRANYRNRMITDAFEPGSTFKTFTLAALVDSDKGDIYDELFCEDGAYEIDGHIINDTHAHGWFTVEEIIVHSSNIGAAKMGIILGRDLVRQYMEKFGFGEKTGIDLPGEGKGIVRSFNGLSRVGLANIAFGQGVAVTGIQLLAGLNALASDGEYYAPAIIQRIESSDGKMIRQFKPRVVGRVVREETVEKVTQVLVNVVHGGGTGKRAAPDGYTVAGKTGTAQKANREEGGYYGDRYVASFMGYAPANNPRLTVLVVVDDPKGEPWGGSVAAPAFREIVERALPLLGILPDETKQRGPTLTSTNGVNGVTYPEPMTALWNAESTASTEITDCENCMPDLVGLTLRQVLIEAEKHNAVVRVTGSGRVINQYPVPGEPLNGVTRWRIELATGPN